MSDYLSETDDVRGDQGRVIRYQERDRARDFLRRSDVEHLIAVSNLSVLRSCRHREVVLRRFGGAVGDLLGEPEWSTRYEANDPSPARASRDMPPGELRDHQGCGSGIDGEVLVYAAQPLALSTRMSTGPSRSSAASNSRPTFASSVRSASIAAAPPPSATMRSTMC